jgi:hypothetical protein
MTPITKEQKPAPEATQRFHCAFGGGVSCSVTVDRSKYRPGQQCSHLTVEWSGIPTAKICRPYVAWMNSVNQTLADAWQVTLLYVYLLPGGLVEGWTFKPGDRPRRVK